MSRTFHRLVALAVVVGLGCTEAEPEPAPPVEVTRFSIAVIADPHVTRSGDKEAALAAAVDWINAETSSRAIELVLVVGDISWGEGGPIAKAQLDRLTPTYVPIIGDNAVVFGSEETYVTTYGPQLDRLAGTLDDWERAPTPVDHPIANGPAWLQNFAFTYRGLRLIGLDWAARGVTGDIASEKGQLQDFDGGTWPFLEAQLPKIERAARRGVIMFSHIPMHAGTFDDRQMARLEGLLDPHYKQLYANLAGHMHLNYELEVGRRLYEVFVTDPPWGEDNTVRLVNVEGDGSAFTYEQELIVIP